MKEELNSLDLEVKRMMLDCPSIFPSRLHCLEFLFCTNGTGYEWQPDGTLKDYDSRSGRTQATSMPEHIEKAEPYDFRITKGVLDEFEAIRMEYEDINRGFREKHIDYLCSTNHIIGEEMSFTRVYPMSWDYCAMGKAADNPHRIADEWREGIREFIRWYLTKVNGYYGCVQDDGSTKIDRIGDPRTKSNYKICLAVLKTMKTDEDRKQEKTLMRFHKKLLDEVIKDMDDV